MGDLHLGVKASHDIWKKSLVLLVASDVGSGEYSKKSYSTETHLKKSKLVSVR